MSCSRTQGNASSEDDQTLQADRSVSPLVNKTYVKTDG